MNKGLSLVLGLLLAAGMAVAQDTNSAQASSTMSNSNQTTVQGCLRGSHDNWTLTDSNGQTWTLKGDDAKWNDHVGHTVSVTGTSDQSSSMPQSTEAGATSKAASGNNTLNVTNLQHVSDSCSGSNSNASSTQPPQSDQTGATSASQSSTSSALPPSTSSSTTAGSTNDTTGTSSSSSSSQSTLPQSSQPPASSSSTGSSLPPTTSQSSSSQPPSSSASSSSTEMSGQASSSQSSTSPSTSQSTLPQSGAASTSNAQNSVRGCLQGQSGSFSLKADDGRMFQLTGDTSKLNDNVNKEVEITGNSGSSETGANSTGQSTLNVTDVRKVADTCSSSGSGSAMPQSGSTPPSSTSQPPSSSSQPPSGPSDPDQDTAAQSSSTPQSGTAAQGTTPQTGAAANGSTSPTADQNANANGTKANGKALPQTASPLPLMGLIGFGSLVSGFIARRRK